MLLRNVCGLPSGKQAAPSGAEENRKAAKKFSKSTTA
jgi:hypothetical protein